MLYKNFTIVLALLFILGAAHADRPVDSIERSAYEWDHDRYRRATIHPTKAHIDPGDSLQFKAVIVATRLMAAEVPKEIQWSVNRIPGGNKEVGTIDSNGVYAAPTVMPPHREIYICAAVPEAANKELIATAIIGAAPISYKSVHVWSEKKGEEGSHLVSPHGIGLDKDENILIADQGGSQVLRYSRTGEFMDPHR